MSQFDDVNKAKHYNVHPSGVEAIEVIRYFPGNLFNAFKYVWRAGLKGTPIKDVDKALYYLQDELTWLPSLPMRQEAVRVTAPLMQSIADADGQTLRGKALQAIYHAAVEGCNGLLLLHAIECVKEVRAALIDVAELA